MLAWFVFLAGLIYEVRETVERRSTFRFIGFLVCSVIGAIGTGEVFRGRIELRDDDIRVVTLFGRKIYPRTTVIDARWEKGAPVSLKLVDGAWARLPATGHASTKVAGAIRAWLNEGRTTDPPRNADL